MSEFTYAFTLLIDLYRKADVGPLHQLDGCWERQIGNWWIALNGHCAERKCSHGGTVPPRTCHVEWDGWPVGLIGLYGGLIAAGSAANEDTFIAAIEAELNDRRSPHNAR